ncbi:MAG TPA: hypothetical protein VMW36_01225, partial [Patescibacteria group bacterium]|nr:hypothetical protein [Patescibacteria group bacterium]
MLKRVIGVFASIGILATAVVLMGSLMAYPETCCDSETNPSACTTYKKCVTMNGGDLPATGHATPVLSSTYGWSSTSSKFVAVRVEEALTDNEALENAFVTIGANYNWDKAGTNWDRQNTISVNTDNVVEITKMPQTAGYNHVFDSASSNWDRWASVAISSDAVAATTKAPQTSSFGHSYDYTGDVWTRNQSLSLDGSSIATGATYGLVSTALNYVWDVTGT